MMKLNDSDIETIMGMSVFLLRIQSLSKDIPNDQEFGTAVRSIVNQMPLLTEYKVTEDTMISIGARKEFYTIDTDDDDSGYYWIYDITEGISIVLEEDGRAYIDVHDTVYDCVNIQSLYALSLVFSQFNEQ